MWGEEWCGVHGVCGESGQGVRVERGGGGLIVQDESNNRGKPASASRARAEHLRETRLRHMTGTSLATRSLPSRHFERHCPTQIVALVSRWLSCVRVRVSEGEGGGEGEVRVRVRR